LNVRRTRPRRTQPNSVRFQLRLGVHLAALQTELGDHKVQRLTPQGLLNWLPLLAFNNGNEPQQL
jgi:hypothetical protein